MRRTLTIAFALALAAAFAFWIASQPGEAAPADLPDAPVTDPGTTGAPLSADLTEKAAAPESADLRREQAEATTPSPSPDEAVLRGRCVDEAGNPLAGVTVRLHGWGANDERLDAYRRDHGEVVWEDPQVAATAADGRFEVRFVPPPPYQFTLDLRHPDLTPMFGRWSEIEQGTVKDFGDVVLSRGVLVTGRVLDVDQVPRAGVQVYLNRYNRADRPRGEVRPRESDQVSSAADGSFAFRHPMAPGTWNLRLRGAQLVEPREEAELELPTTGLDLVVQRPAEVVAVRGIVVDENGNPVRGANVQPQGRYGGGWMTTSARDGTFTLEKRDRGEPEAAFHLHVEREGYEYLTTEDTYEWGDADVHLVLRSGIDVHVWVRRADDGTPVEEFGLRLFPKPGTVNRWSSRNAQLRGVWEHEGGHEVVKGIRRGTHWVVAEPRSRTGLGRGGPVEVVVRDGPAPTVEVRLPVLSRQEVRVARTDGSAVAGSTVELLEAIEGEEVGPGTRALTLETWYYQTSGKALLADGAKTDAAGACTLEGTMDREYSVRVIGETHAPVVRSGVRFGVQPLEIVVPSGATVRVTLRPLELLGDLREQAQLPRNGEVAENERNRLPGIRLQRRVGEGVESFPAGAGNPKVPFDEDGLALLRGAPSGIWDLQLVSSTSHGPTSYGTGGDTVRTGIALREGEETAFTLDMPEAVRGRLRGRVTVAGEPTKGQVELSAVLGTRPDGTPLTETRYTESDADGRFETLLPPGTWRAGPWVRLGDNGVRAYSPAAVTVVSGQTTEADFDVRLGRVKIRLLRPDGEPAVGVDVQFQRGGQHLNANCPSTDAEGRTTATATPGDAVPRVRARRFTDPEEFRKYWEQHRGDPAALQRTLVPLPPVLFAEGEPREVELRLPPEWDR